MNVWLFLGGLAFTGFSLGGFYGAIVTIAAIRNAIKRERRRAEIRQAYFMLDGRKVIYTPAGFTRRFTYRGRDVDDVTLRALTLAGERVVNEDAALDRYRGQDWWILDEIGLGDFTGCRENALLLESRA